MKKTILCLFLIFLPASFLRPQINMDSLAMYHPLHKENMWIYHRTHKIAPDITAYITRQVTGDTMIDGKLYQTIIEYSLNSAKPLVRCERFDTLTGNYYDDLSMEVTLDVDFSLADSTVTNQINASFRSGKLVDLFQDSVFGALTTVREIKELFVIDVSIHKRFAHGFGLVREEHGGMESSTDSLIYAQINGAEYGSRPLLVDDKRRTLPLLFSLSQNYPNPFNPTTTIEYQLPQSSFVTLKILDILGKEVAEIVNEKKDAGTHSVHFNASTLASDIYFYHLRAGEFAATKKMIILK